MNKNKSTIIINGRHYDALSGKLLPGQKPPEPARHPAHHRIVHGHRSPKHLAAHHPEPSQTLMRKAVKKPPTDFKRRIKVQGHLGVSAQRDTSKIISRSTDRSPNVYRLQSHATKHGKGRLISHFSPELFAVDSHTSSAAYGTAAVNRLAAHAAGPQNTAHTAPASAPKTTDELLEYAVRRAPAHAGHPHKRERKVLGHRAHAHHTR